MFDTILKVPECLMARPNGKAFLVLDKTRFRFQSSQDKSNDNASVFCENFENLIELKRK